MNEKSWDEMEEEERESACEYTEYPICPYCGHKHDYDTFEYFKPDEVGTYECDDCGRVFYYESNISVDYCTKKL